jgi:hypothetical protein
MRQPLDGVDPQSWLSDVLRRIADHKISRIEELLPWRYAQTSGISPALIRSLSNDEMLISFREQLL